MKVGFVGLGVMGYPMAGHLQAAGHEVTVFNRSADKAARWVEQYAGRAGFRGGGGSYLAGRCPVVADGYYKDVQSMGGGRWDTSSLFARMRARSSGA